MPIYEVRANALREQIGARNAADADDAYLSCPYCGSMNPWPMSGLEAAGVFVPYCPSGDCEDMDDFPNRS